MNRFILVTGLATAVFVAVSGNSWSTETAGRNVEEPAKIMVAAAQDVGAVVTGFDRAVVSAYDQTK